MQSKKIRWEVDKIYLDLSRYEDTDEYQMKLQKRTDEGWEIHQIDFVTHKKGQYESNSYVVITSVRYD